MLKRGSKLLFTLIAIASCSESAKKDPAVIAESHNEAKFNDPDKEQDSERMVKTAGFYLQQIKLCQLAQENSTDKNIQQTGKILEKEYRELYGLTKDLCEKKGISIPRELDDAQKEKNRKLSYEISDDFDKRFLKMTIRDHQKAAKECERYASLSKDAEIKDLFRKSLKRIRKHFIFILLQNGNKIKEYN